MKLPVSVPVTQFKVSQLYSNDDISITLGVGNAGGIRPHIDQNGAVRRVVLMTATPESRVIAENPYHDRVEGDVLIYTGAGRRGDQEPTGVNRRLVEQDESRFPVWCFRQAFSRRDKTVGKNRWEFLGLLTLLRYYQERQVDSLSVSRIAWVFEFGIAKVPLVVPTEDDIAITAELYSRPAVDSLIDRTPIDPEPALEDADETALEQLRSRMLAVEPRDFELLIKSLLDASGYESVMVTRYSQDGGIDVNAGFGPTGWPVRGCRVQVQAKRWLHSVGRKEVAELRGSLGHDGIGCLITTSHFTKAAVIEATEIGKSPITLVNGRQLARLLKSHNITPHAE